MPVSGRRAVRPDGGVYRQRRRRKVSRIAILDIFRGNQTGYSRRRSWISPMRFAAVVWLVAMIVVIYFIWRHHHG